ncbi:MAG: hypothetical protein NVS2B11_07630 [Acetobacteraceae bacterium]
MGRYTAGGVGRDVVAGAIAGAVAIWAMDKLDWKLYRAGGPDRIRRTEAARPGGKDPAHVLAGRAADKLGVSFGDPKDNPAGHAIHYGAGGALGALYGLLRGISPRFAAGRGGVYGIATWAMGDEGLNMVMGTSGHPLSYPWQDHARGAATHTLFGVVADLVARILSPWRDEVVIVQGPPMSERLEQGRHTLNRLTDQAASRFDATRRTYIDPLPARAAAAFDDTRRSYVNPLQARAAAALDDARRNYADPLQARVARQLRR